MLGDSYFSDACNNRKNIKGMHRVSVTSSPQAIYSVEESHRRLEESDDAAISCNFMRYSFATGRRDIDDALKVKRCTLL